MEETGHNFNYIDTKILYYIKKEMIINLKYTND